MQTDEADCRLRGETGGNSDVDALLGFALRFEILEALLCLLTHNLVHQQRRGVEFPFDVSAD